MYMVVIDKDKCKCCELCVGKCPMKILEVTTESNILGYNYIKQTIQEKCTGCGICYLMCPEAAITVIKK